MANYWIRTVKIAMSLAVLALLTSPAAAEKYTGQNLNFTIPEGWKVLNESNETKIILSDDLNSIEIDLIRVPDDLREAVRNYKDLDGYESYGYMDKIGRYYLDYINRTDMGQFGTGSTINFHPDEFEYPLVGFNYFQRDPIPFDGEWFVSWAQPEYEDKIIGIHARFPGNSTEVVPTGWHGTAIPEPLFVILKDFETNLERR